MDNRIFLRVKANSLAEEVRIIKKLIHSKRSYGRRHELRSHHRHVIRPEARATTLALAFFHGRAYSEAEQAARTPPQWTVIERMVEKYGIERSPDLSFNDRKEAINRLMISYKMWEDEAQKWFASHRIVG